MDNGVREGLGVIQVLAVNWWKSKVCWEIRSYLRETAGNSNPQGKSFQDKLATIRDITYKVVSCSYWEWTKGLTSFYWRWPKAFSLMAREGVPVYLIGDLPTYT